MVDLFMIRGKYRFGYLHTEVAKGNTHTGRHFYHISREIFFEKLKGGDIDRNA